MLTKTSVTESGRREGKGCQIGSHGNEGIRCMIRGILFLEDDVNLFSSLIRYKVDLIIWFTNTKTCRIFITLQDVGFFISFKIYRRI